MVYDPVDGYTVLFGGLVSEVGGQATGLDDTWIFQAGAWMELFPSISPSARWGASMTFDSSDGYVLLFGGVPPCPPSVPMYDCPLPLNDTWTFEGGTWTEVQPTVSPSPRAFAAMSYDSTTGSVVLFGGEGKTGGLGADNDTWTYHAGQWSSLHPTESPPANVGEVMADDVSDGYLVMFGVFGGTTPGKPAPSDTWEFIGGNWSQIVTSVAPAAASWASMTWDPAGGYVLLFGGMTGLSDNTNWTWAYAAGTWTNLTPSPSPPARAWASMTFDSSEGYVLLFSGSNSRADTWAFYPLTTKPAGFLGLPGYEGYALMGGAAATGVMAAAVALVIQRRARARELGRTGRTATGAGV